MKDNGWEVLGTVKELCFGKMEPCSLAIGNLVSQLKKGNLSSLTVMYMKVSGL